VGREVGRPGGRDEVYMMSGAEVVMPKQRVQR